MDGRIPLYYVSAAIGGVIAISCIWLLAKQKIYLNEQSKEMIEVEFPLIGKFKTGYPVLVLFMIAFVMVIYPLNLLNQIENFPKTEEMDVTGTVTAHYPPVLVYAAPAGDMSNADGVFHVRVPFTDKQGVYRILVIENGHVAAEGSAARTTAQKGVINVQLKRVEVAPSPWATQIAAVSNLAQYLDLPQAK